MRVKAFLSDKKCVQTVGAKVLNRKIGQQFALTCTDYYGHKLRYQIMNKRI